ncbi:hypothetical protein JCM10212_007075 [Sporobolomyces blumeae]
MTTLHPTALALYRRFLRGTRLLARGDRSHLANLRRLYRPQWAEELSRARKVAQLDAVRLKMSSTLSLLRSSPRLLKNLSSLAYHHYPFYLPSTSNASRLYSHQPKPIEWDPKNPRHASKAYEKRRKDDEKAEAVVSRLVDVGLRGMRARAEQEEGIALGRWESRG